MTKHIAREHAGDDNAFYTFVPNINEFGPRDDDMPCSQYCVDEGKLALLRSKEEKKLKQRLRNEANKEARRQAAIDATQVLDRAYKIQVGNQPLEVEG